MMLWCYVGCTWQHQGNPHWQTSYNSHQQTFVEQNRVCFQGCRTFQTVQYNKIFKPKLSDKKCVILRHLATFYKVSQCKNFSVQSIKIMFWTLNVQPLDNWTQHCPAIGQLNTALSDHWTVGHSIVRALDSWIQYCPTIGQLDRALSNHWTVDTALSNH